MIVKGGQALSVVKVFNLAVVIIVDSGYVFGSFSINGTVVKASGKLSNTNGQVGDAKACLAKGDCPSFQRFNLILHK